MNRYFFLILFLVSVSIFSKILPDSTEAITDSTIEKKVNDTADVEIPEGLTARDVINKYLNAIGGAENIYNIIDRTTIMRGSIQGINVTIISYQKAPNKLKQQIKAGANEQLIIFNGEKGIMKMAGEEEEIRDSELEKLKYEATLTLLTDPEHHGIKLSLEGIEKVEDDDAYKVTMILPSGIKWSQFYNVESGLKVKEDKFIKTPLGLFEQEIMYDDYKEVEGHLYPFKIRQTIGVQSMEFTVSSIKINTGLADREFEIE